MTLDVLGIDASRAAAAAMTGTEWYSWEIIRAIADTSERPMLRLYQREPGTITTAARVEHQVIRRPRCWTPLGLGPEMRRNPPDALFVPAHFLPPWHPPASVVTIHDLGYLAAGRTHTRRRRISLDLTTRWSARRAARIIVPSTATSRDLQRHYGTDPAKIDVIHHGIDHERFRVLPPEETAEGLERLGLRQPYLLFLSTIQPRKNLSRLIAAFEALDLDDLALVVAGADGWMSTAIYQRMARSTHSNQIIRLGYVPEELVPALYNGAQAFVLPSLYEGFGMGVIEAMACGCPVVTSSTSCLPEIAGGAAIIVDPLSVESICDGVRLVLDPNQRQRLRHAGLRRASQFTWERCAVETLESIRRAYAEASTGSAP
ncbi:MAG TPA: glycosyltransferase family 1 protein [Thermomicrobiales bacterium]|nr:glycosyltransferase family 1 protein [Thermomicrobiales bacterium]